MYKCPTKPFRLFKIINMATVRNLDPMAESRCRLGGTPDSYLEDPGFNFGPADRLP
jgi:hypothetical protein